MKSSIGLSSILLLLTPLLSVNGYEDNGEEDNSIQKEACNQEIFYCDYKDPSVFYRCIDHVYYIFNCPRGLHFSAIEQTCDWPHASDCSGGELEADIHDTNQVEDDSSHSSEESLQTEDHGENNVVSSNQDNAKGKNDAEESTWISQAAAAGKSWWRPAGLKSKQWLDVKGIQKPEFKPHVPDPPKSDSESETSKSAETKSSNSSSSKEKSDNSQSASGDKQESSELHWNEGSCSSSCQLPSCYCPGSDIPKGMSISSVPQMVMLTFDDEVSAAFYGYYQRLFRPGRYNPNGCPIRGCLFVSGSGTDYDLVYPLYAMGVEIASHTVSHKFPHNWWASASYQDYVDEVAGMRDNLIKKSGIPRESIKGFRVPFLQLGGDNMYSALYDSQFVYDTSMFTGSQWEGDDPIWPFTLDYVPNNTYCQHGPCPTKQYPGMWEIPVQRWYGLDGHSCAMPDGCSSTGDDEETLEYLKSNFRRFYGINRAPFGIFIHARWFHSEHTMAGLDRFIDYLLTLDDVYLVTPSQVIDWMNKPTPLSSINAFETWNCQGGAKDLWSDQET